MRIALLLFMPVFILACDGTNSLDASKVAVMVKEAMYWGISAECGEVYKCGMPCDIKVGLCAESKGVPTCDMWMENIDGVKRYYVQIGHHNRRDVKYYVSFAKVNEETKIAGYGYLSLGDGVKRCGAMKLDVGQKWHEEYLKYAASKNDSSLVNALKKEYGVKKGAIYLGPNTEYSEDVHVYFEKENAVYQIPMARGTDNLLLFMDALKYNDINTRPGMYRYIKERCVRDGKKI